MPILKRLLAQAAMGAMILASLSGCDRGSTREVVVDQHTFRVPDKYLVKGSIPWLPASQQEGLSFVINPDARPQEQKIVGLRSARITCNPQTPPTSNMLSSTCLASKEMNKAEAQKAFAPEKVYPHEGITFQWEYRVKDTDENYRVVASCTSVGGGKEGLCHSLGGYKNLVYSVSLRDSEMQRLPEIWAKVREMLASWEVGPGTGE